MLTTFGKKVRNYCIEKSIKQKDMARALRVSSAYLSAIQNGTQEIPYYFTPRIIDFLQLDKKQSADLAVLAQESRKFIKIDMRKYDESSKMLTAVFSVFSQELDQAGKEKIIQILYSYGEK